MPALQKPTTRSIPVEAPPREDHPPLRAYFGHHKCATGDNILREICLHLALRFRIVHLPKHFEAYESLGAFAREEDLDFLSYTNADATYVADLPPFRGFHVVRDPRDILVSAYFSHKNSLKAPEWNDLTEIRQTLQDVSKEEGLFIEMDFLEWEFEQMLKWNYNQENVLEVKMEHLTAAPREQFPKILSFLGLLDDSASGRNGDYWTTLRLKMNRWNHRGRRLMPGQVPLFPFPRRRFEQIPMHTLEEILELHRFARLAGGRSKGEEDVTSHYRKGVPGDWRNHFIPDHIERFKARYNDLLLELGYETKPDW